MSASQIRGKAESRPLPRCEPTWRTTLSASIDVATFTVLASAAQLAPDNEQVIGTSLNYYLLSGNYAEFGRLAASRLAEIIDAPGMPGTTLYFQRLVTAATARLALDDAVGAGKLLTTAIPQLRSLDPNPDAVYALALFARAKVLQDDREGAVEIFAGATEIAGRARTEGWGVVQLDYSLAAAAAAVDRRQDALEYLRVAIAAGWRDVVFADHDPALAGLRDDPAYHAMLEKL